MSRLGRLARTISGVGFPPKEQGATAGDLPFLKVSDLADPRNARGVVTAANWITNQQARDLGVRRVPPGSIIFPKVGAALLGNARALTRVECALDNNMMAVTPSHGDSRYWLYVLRTVDLGELNMSGTLPFVSDSAVRDLDLPLNRDLEEQRRVADFLDDQVARIDQIIAARRRQRELVDEVLTSSIRNGVAGVLPGVQTIGVDVPWIGCMAAAGDIRPLSRIVTLQRGIDLTAEERRPGDVPVVTTGGVVGFHDSAKARGPGVVIGRYGTAGAVFWVEADFWPHNTTLYVKEFFGNDRRWCYYLLTSYPYAMLQARSAVPGVNRNDMAADPMPWIPLDLQRRAVSDLDEYVNEASNHREALSESAALLEELKRSLITAAVIGEFDVSSADGSRVSACG